MADNGPRILRRTRGVAALPVRFTALEQRQAALEAQLPALQAHALQSHRAALGEGLAELQAALHAEIEVLRGELADLGRLVEDRVDAETELVELIGKLLRRAEARLEALEGQRA